MFKTDINDIVRVRLTVEGHKQYEQFHQEIARSSSVTFERVSEPNEDADGWSEFKLWDLMQIFGPALHTGGENFFEDNVLEIKKLRREPPPQS